MLLTLKLEMVEVVQLVPMKTSESGGRWSRGSSVRSNCSLVALVSTLLCRKGERTKLFRLKSELGGTGFIP